MILTNFTTVQGYNCIFGNAYNTLRYFHTDVLEQDLFFWFSEFQGSKDVDGLFNTFYEEIEKNSWLDFVEKSIDSQRPVLLSIDPRVLPYIKHEAGDSSIKHNINIIGIDIENKKMCVSDSYVPTYSPTTYTGWIDYTSISDSHIENCRGIKSSAIHHFQTECTREDIWELTFSNIIKRLGAFLNEDKAGKVQPGIDKLDQLHDMVVLDIANNNYENIFKLLAGIRLNVINPLIYLRLALERKQNQYQDLISSLESFTNNYWERFNIQLIKFSIAHKRLDEKKISEQIKNTIFEEQVVLNAILEKLVSNYKM